jgi:hypothetical protein
VLISYPRGFTLVDSSHDLQRIAEEAIPPANRLLAYFARRSDLRARSQGKLASFDRYFLVQTLRKIEDQSFSVEDFARLRSIAKNQQSEALAKLEPRLAELSHDLERRRSGDTWALPGLKVGDVVPLGIYQDSESGVSFGAMSRAPSADDRTVLNVTSIVTVKGKVLFLYTYASVAGRKDIEWAKHASATWSNDVVAVNR